MGRTALVDADVLRYECASVGQKLNKETGEIEYSSFDFVKKVFDERIETIVNGSTSDSYSLFLTGDRATHRILGRNNPSLEEYRPNFREALATGKVYKGTRKQDKPFHWINLTAYILSKSISEPTSLCIANGCEADDEIAITAISDRTRSSIICTRDKDLRMVPGWHYGWECGKQPEFGPVEYDSLGEIELVRNKSTAKIKGGGFKFFGSQLLTGDVVDNIGGAKGIGPVKCYQLLKDCDSERSVFDTVRRTYEEMDPEHWKELLKEQCSLLWIVRERNDDGSLKHFNIEEWL